MLLHNDVFTHEILSDGAIQNHSKYHRVFVVKLGAKILVTSCHSQLEGTCYDFINKEG